MANFVWNKVFCDKETLEKYFLDYYPLGEDELFGKPYITFNKLFDVKSITEYREKIGVDIYNGYSFSHKQVGENRYEIMFCTKWKYPIEAIKKAISISHDTEWYAVETNCIYVSKFYWDEAVKEKVMFIEDEYSDWLDEHLDFDDSLEDPDFDVWYFLQTAKSTWHEWESDDDFKRYEESVYEVPFPFYEHK